MSKRAPRVWVIVARLMSDKCYYLVGKRGPTCRNPGQWNFLGGNVDSGETLTQAAKREAYEESGLHIIESDLSMVFKDMVKSRPVTWFAVSSGRVVNMSALHISAEITEYAWADLSWAGRKDLHYSVSRFFEWASLVKNKELLDTHGVLTDLKNKGLS